MVNGSPDMHVIDVDTGNDVFVRDNGAFDYLELVLPNDVDGVPGCRRRQRRHQRRRRAADALLGRSDERLADADDDCRAHRLLLADGRQQDDRVPGGRRARAVDVGRGGAAGDGDQAGVERAQLRRRRLGAGRLHRHRRLGARRRSRRHAIARRGAATAKADLFSPVYLSDDGADIYYFQGVSTQDSQGTLMHVAATAGSTPNKVADTVSLSDVHPQAGGVLLYLANLDDTGVTGDAFKSARDGSGAMALGTGVQVGFLQVQTPAAEGAGSSKWVSVHLTGSMENKTQQLVDGIRDISGALEVSSAAGTSMVDPMARIGQQVLSDDFATLVYVGGSVFDSTVDNYVGVLENVPVATPTMKPTMPLLTGVSEVATIVGKSFFVNAPKASTPGVYFVSF